MTKTEIIDAAFKVWGRNFYKKTSLSQLASELKVSKPALYRHFKSKNDLTAAMIERFFDDFSNSVRDDFQKALQTEDADIAISTVVVSMSGFFARNAYSLIFSMMNVYDRNLDRQTAQEKLKLRGVDMSVLKTVAIKKYKSDDSLIGLIFATQTFFVSNFHRAKKAMKTPLSDANIEAITSYICATVMHGLGFPSEKADIDFDKLEKMIESDVPQFQSEPFIKAVAEAVAETGPWEVSMEMIAKKLGLSKSSLYGHFKNKRDMLKHLFETEFRKIIGFARQGISKSEKAAEQLYLGILSIAIYLRAHNEILVAMDWIRTRKLDLGKPDKNMEIFRLFEDVDIEPLRSESEEKKQAVSHWILFLLINILTHPDGSTANLQNNSIRLLYKYVILGLGGFIK